MQIDLAKVRVAGSAEEVREIGLNPAQVYTCGPERPGVRACPMYEKCSRPEKDRQGFVTWTKDGQSVKSGTEGAAREGPGPLNLGIQRFKRTGVMSFKVINSTCACWEYPHQKRNWESANVGGEEPRAGCKIIAIEGQRIHLPGSLPVPQEDLKIIHVRQPEGVDTLIKPIPRPRENPAFAQSAFAVAELTREAGRIQNSDLKDFVKLRKEPEPDEAFDLGTTKPVTGKPQGGASSRG